MPTAMSGSATSAGRPTACSSVSARLANATARSPVAVRDANTYDCWCGLARGSGRSERLSSSSRVGRLPLRLVKRSLTWPSRSRGEQTQQWMKSFPTHAGFSLWPSIRHEPLRLRAWLARECHDRRLTVFDPIGERLMVGSVPSAHEVSSPVRNLREALASNPDALDDATKLKLRKRRLRRSVECRPSTRCCRGLRLCRSTSRLLCGFWFRTPFHPRSSRERRYLGTSPIWSRQVIRPVVTRPSTSLAGVRPLLPVEVESPDLV